MGRGDVAREGLRDEGRREGTESGRRDQDRLPALGDRRAALESRVAGAATATTVSISAGGDSKAPPRRACDDREGALTVLGANSSDLGCLTQASRVAILQAPSPVQPTTQPTMTRTIAHVGIGGISSPDLPRMAPRTRWPMKVGGLRNAGRSWSRATPTTMRCP